MKAPDERRAAPDGQWLAYCATGEGDAAELYVMPYPGPGLPVRVTTDGATQPAWSWDGKELFYRNGRYMMAVPFTVSGTEFRPGRPVPVFEDVFVSAGFTRGYDVTRDGRFLMRRAVRRKPGEPNEIFPSKLRFALNWHEELKRLALAN